MITVWQRGCNCMGIVKGKSYRKVWENGLHNAFTHLVEWRGNLYLVFRTGKNHVSVDGEITLLCSPDRGITWEHVRSFPSPTNKDFRDPKLLPTPEALYLHAFDYDSSIPKKDSYVSSTSNGINWTEPVRVSPEDDIVIWWPGYYDGKFYGTGYKYARSRTDIRSIFLTSPDGINWEKVSMIYDSPHSNEAAFIMKKNGEAHVLVRTPDVPVLARSFSPFKEWTIEKLPRVIQGFSLDPFAGGYLIVGRIFEGDEAKTALLTWNKGELTVHEVFPSGGDTAYPGVIREGNNFLISYYSSHEHERHGDITPSDIYLAHLELVEACY